MPEPLPTAPITWQGRDAEGKVVTVTADTNELVSPIEVTSEAGAGGVTVDNQSDPPAEVTTLIAPGADVGTPGEATLAGRFVASATDPGAIGAGGVWKDISGGPGLNAVWWERNADNDGWDATFLVEAFATDAIEVQVGTVANSVDGDGFARLDANVTGDGAAFAKPTAFTTGAGAATAGGVATASGGGDADAGSLASTISGTAFNYVLADRNGVQGGLNVEIGAGGPVVTLLGLPTADPVVANALWIDTAAGRVIKVSAG